MQEGGGGGEIKFLDSYSNLKQIKNITGLWQASVKKYINTDYPKNGYLFYTTPLVNLTEAFQLTKELTLVRPYKYNRITPVWGYKLNIKGKLELINNGQPFESKRVFANYINFNDTLIDVYINSLKPDSNKGIYYFDSPITLFIFLFNLKIKKNKKEKEQEDSILNNPIFLKAYKQEIFLYNRLTMELINGKPFETIIAAVKFLTVDRSHFIEARLDSNKPFIVKGVSYLAFRKELSSKSISDFLNNNLVK